MGRTRKVYRVILVAEDGEYVLRETSSLQSAYNFLDRESSKYGEGQRLTVREVSTWF